MKYLFVIISTLSLLFSAFGQTPATQTDQYHKLAANVDLLPQNAIGRTLRDWLAAVNSGDGAAIAKFVESRFSANALRFQRSAAQFTEYFKKLHRQSGGLDVVSFTPAAGAGPTAMLVKARNGDAYARITAGMDRAEPEKLSGLGIDRARSPNASISTSRPAALTEKSVISDIEAHLAKSAAEGLFSGVVMIAKDDRVLLQNAYGFADREARIPNSLETKFHLASIGKMFTAAAIAQLVTAGKISFDDTVGKAYPDFPVPEIAQKITIRQLLTHSAGLGTFFESPGFKRGKVFRNAAEQIEVYKNEKLFFEPGTGWRYSNAGYALLAAIIEHHSGKTYPEYLRENIFRPLNMRDTYTAVPGAAEPGASVFYRQSPDDPMGIEPYDGDRDLAKGQVMGFGGGFSNAGDLFKFLRAYRTGKLLGKEMTEQLFSFSVNQDASGSRRSALGVVEYQVNGETIRGHVGGSRSEVEMLWNSGYTVIIMTNVQPPTVQAFSGPIIDLLTKQAALRTGSPPRIR